MCSMTRAIELSACFASLRPGSGSASRPEKRFSALPEIFALTHDSKAAAFHQDVVVDDDSPLPSPFDETASEVDVALVQLCDRPARSRSEHDGGSPHLFG